MLYLVCCCVRHSINFVLFCFVFAVGGGWWWWWITFIYVSARNWTRPRTWRCYQYTLCTAATTNKCAQKRETGAVSLGFLHQNTCIVLYYRISKKYYHHNCPDSDSNKLHSRACPRQSCWIFDFCTFFGDTTTGISFFNNGGGSSVVSRVHNDRIDSSTCFWLTCGVQFFFLSKQSLATYDTAMAPSRTWLLSSLSTNRHLGL